ncbi:hypothetical protein AAE02nite_08800 [Adhaeribacter aerolatus]|uniref:Glycosyltransferase 61 catalytic domain-containing protein n=1 Tax=Adhaeribacter aerolatus TaxID=670289 RepID=A0A512AU25_9BACT|nr:glycosyltransferase family 61 protein [Adhaeribacter aerolatus]GEO03216.1 hypothetical protein AAE02nite_08800 [Adhaeribacter aerolatus]
MPDKYNISFPESSIHINLPANCIPGEEEYYNMSLEGSIRSCSVLELDYVYANRELILWKNNEMLPEAFAWPWLKDKLYGTTKDKLKFQVKRFIRKNTVVNEPVLWCLDGYSTGGYFHWITDILPRLWMAKQYLPEIKFAIPDYFFQYWPFITEFFELLNVKEFLEVKSDKNYLLKKLILPTRAGNPFYIQPIPLTEGVNWLKSEALKKSSKRVGDRLYVSRAKARFRKILNEPDLEPILNKYGFQTIYFEDYSLADQISICQHAKVIMGLHGAGLTNLAFLSENSKVIEIRPSAVNHMYTCFFTLSPYFKVEYNYILCNYAPIPLPNEKRIDDHSVILDPEEFDCRLKSIT